MAEWTIWNALRDALRINSGILFLFVNRENLRIFPIYFFTGRGCNGWSAVFLHDPSRENSVWSGPQAATNTKNKNSISAKYAQSEAEGILNYYSRLCFLQNCLLTQYIPPHSRTASTRYNGFFMELTSDCPNTAIMAIITPLPSSMVMR